MSGEVGFTEITGGLVQSWLDDAYLEPRIDGEGDILLRIDRTNLWVTVDQELGVVKLRAIFPSPTSCVDSVLRAVNRINVEYVMVKVSAFGGVSGVAPQHQLGIEFEHDMVLGNGSTSPRHPIATLRRFAGIVDAAAVEHLRPLIRLAG